MTERDGAWMARILARFTPEMVAALVKMGQFSKPFYTSHVTEVMEARLEKVLARYLTKLSPITDVHLDGATRLCGIDLDLARARGVVAEDRFHYAASLAIEDGPPSRTVPVVPGKAGEVCLELPHVAEPVDDDWRANRRGFGAKTGSSPCPVYTVSY